MNIPIILPLLSGIFVIFLGILVYRRNPKLELNTIFFLLALCISIWLFGTFMMFLNRDNKPSAILWDRFIYIGVTFVPATFYHFSLVFGEIRRKRLLILSYILSTIFLILSRTKYFVDDLFKYKWGVHTQARIFHHFFLVYFSIYLILVLINFYRTYRFSKGLKKQQAKYVLIAFLILIPVGSTAYLPAYKIGIYPFSYLSGVFFTTVLAYAIVRYRLMDIRIVVRSVTIYGVSLIVSLGLSLLLMLLAINYLSFYVSSPFVLSLIILFGIIVFQLVKEKFSQFANKYLFYPLYSFEKTLSELIGKLTKTLDLNRLIFLSTETIKDVIKLDKIALILKRLEIPKGQLKLLENRHNKNLSSKKEEFYLARNVGFDQKAITSLTKNKFILHYLEKGKSPIVKDELEYMASEIQDEHLKDKFLKLANFMSKTGAAVYLPLLIEERLIGLFILGRKVSNDAYTIQDLKLLETVTDQIAIAINNAQLYEQTQYFNQILRVRVIEATKELADAYRELKKLDESKTEFLSLASHQLRTPLSAIKGYLSMILEGDYGKLHPETEMAIRSVYESNERLIKIVDDLLNVARIEAGKLEYNPVPANLEELIKSVIAEMKLIAERKNLKLKYSSGKIPKFSFDPNRIREVITNLIDNAIKYTEKGEINVKTELLSSKKEVKVEVKDTGIGISPEKMSSLFQWFSRGKGAYRLETGGFGLGLYIAKKIIEKAGGKIWAESEGKGKGSTFIFTLPIVKNNSKSKII